MTRDKIAEIFEESTGLKMPMDRDFVREEVTLTMNQIYRLAYAIRREYVKS
jgi:hypothetical protein